MLCWLTQAGDQPRYPKGRSTQTYKGREFELLAPEDLDVKKRYSLMFVVGGGTRVQNEIFFDPAVREPGPRVSAESLRKKRT